jgi:hypothetical protein|tara:strand:- start:272 stop:1210 length:939 start_codon:yes stop_codon:yes gene_type:complete
MSFDVSTLTNYVNEQSTDLISRLYFEKTSSDYFTLQSGVKKTDALHLLAVTAFPQDGSGCSPASSGAVTFSNRDLTVGQITYFSGFCMKDLIPKYTQILLRAGNAETESMTFEAEVAESVIKTIMEQNEVADWNGDTTSADVYINKYDGLIKIIDAATTAVDGNTSAATAITSGAAGNVDTLVSDMTNARPATVKSAPNQVLFVGQDTFDKYVDTLNAKNLYHVNATDWANYTVSIPGKNVTLVGVNGLDGTDRMFLGTQENFFLGFDLQNDEEEFDMWYDKKDDKVYYRVKFKRGLQVAYPNEIVEFTLAV